MRSIALAVLMILIEPLSAVCQSADTVVTNQTMPLQIIDVPTGMILRPRVEDGTRTVFRPDEEYKCFNVVEWAKVGHLITDYRWLWYYANSMESKVALLRAETENLELQLTIFRDSTKRADAVVSTMFRLLESSQKWQAETNGKLKTELWLWRTGAIISVALAGIFAGAWGSVR